MSYIRGRCLESLIALRGVHSSLAHVPHIPGRVLICHHRYPPENPFTQTTQPLGLPETKFWPSLSEQLRNYHLLYSKRKIIIPILASIAKYSMTPKTIFISEAIRWHVRKQQG